MKILYVYSQMPDVYQHYLLGLLSKIKKKAYVKTLVYQESSNSDFSVNSYGFKDRFVRLCYNLNLTKNKSLDLKIMQQFDIIHLQHSFLWQKLKPLLKLKNRPKLVITMRGADTYLKPWTYKTLANFYNDGSDNIDAFVVMTNHQKQYLARWGIAEKKIHVIPISFTQEVIAQPKYPNKERLKLVSAFRMTWEKNITGHLLFAKSIKDKGIPFSYDIYGDGEDIDQLYFLVNKYQLEDYVNIKGVVENSELKKALPDYDFFVQLSITESLGMSVIEAQSLGVPCVVSNSGGMPEVVVQNETGIVGDFTNIVDIADGCVALWKNNDLFFSYSQNAILNVNNKFSVENEMEGLQLLYTELHR